MFKNSYQVSLRKIHFFSSDAILTSRQEEVFVSKLLLKNFETLFYRIAFKCLKNKSSAVVAIILITVLTIGPGQGFAANKCAASNTVTPGTTQTLCQGSPANALTATITLNGSGNDGNVRYDWYSNTINSIIGGTFVQTTNTTTNKLTDTYTPSTSSAGTLWYYCIVTNIGGSCSGTTFSSSTVQIVVNPKPAMTSSNLATICSGGTVSIPLTSSVVSSYIWMAADNPNSTGESTTSQSGSTLSNTITNNTSSVQTVTYTVIPTSTSGGCVGTSQTVTVTVNPRPSMTSSNTSTICSGGSVSIPLTSSVVSSYIWMAADNPNSTGESTTSQSSATLSNTITNNTSSVQTVTYTVTPTLTAGGCVGTAQTVTVTVNPKPSMTSFSAATICSGGMVNIALASDAASSYTWIATDNLNTTGESTTSQSSSTLSNTITNNTSSVQTVTYTVTPTSTGGGCVGTSQTVTVTINPKPSMTNSNAATICSGGMISMPLTSDVASSYTWIATDNPNTTGESTTSQSSSTLSNTITNNTSSVQTVTYTVTPTSTGGGCVGTSQTVTVTINPKPSMTNSNAATICSAGMISIPLTSDVASSYTWIATDNLNTTGESTTSQSSSTLSNTITNNTSSVQTVTYTVTPTSTGGSCVGTSQTVIITVNPTPTVNSINDQTICNNSPTAFINFSGSVFGTIYSWTNNNTAIGLAASGIGNIPSFATTNTGTAPSIATFTVTPSANSCSGTSTIFTITVNPSPQGVLSSNGNICGSGNGQLIWTSVAGVGPFAVIYDDETNPYTQSSVTNGTAFNVANNPIGSTATYSLVSVTDANGCIRSSGFTGSSATISVHAPPVIIDQPDANETICATFPVSFTVSATGDGLTYQWYKSGVPLADGSSISGTTTPTLTIDRAALSDAGIYYVVVSGISPCAAVTSNQAVLNIDQEIFINSDLVNQTVCEGNTATFSVASTGSNLSYVWRKGTTILSDGGNISGAATSTLTISNVSFADASPGKYSVTITDTATSAGTCNVANSAKVSLTVNKNSTISLSSASGTEVQKVCINNAITDITYAIAGGGNGVTVSGLPAGVTGVYNSGIFMISGTPTESGIFNYTVTTQGPCINPSLSGTITVNANSTLLLTSTTSTTTQTVCINNAISNITYAVAGGVTGVIVSGLPAGVTGIYNSGVLTISGTPTQSGIFNYTVTTQGPCTNPSLSGTITVNPNSTLLLTSTTFTTTQTVCINNAISNITYAIAGGGTGATVSGLPAGVTGIYNSGVLTISGTPTQSGIFNYTVTTQGPCINPSLSGIITVNANSTLLLTSTTSTTTQTVCINNAISNITYAIAGGGTGATVSGLPAGVTGIYNSGVLTISGTPTQSGIFNYTVTSQGPCINPSLSGTIKVNANSTLALTSSASATAQTVCINNAISNITYAVAGGGTGATVSGVPAGVSGVYNSGVFTISGIPIQAGTFNYTVTSQGSCINPTLNGTITVSPASVGGTLSPSTAFPCSASNSGTITLSGQTGSVVRWESSTNGGTTWITIANTGTTQTYSNLTQSTIYRAVVQSGACSTISYSSNAVISIIPPLIPSLVTASSSTMCLGSGSTLTATGYATTTGPFSGGDFNNANPQGWQVTESGVSINFPANANNTNTNPWSETNPKTFNGVSFNNAPSSGKFAIANGAENSTLETPVFSTVGLTSASLDFKQAFNFNAGTSAKIEISTDGGATYNTTLASYNPPSTYGSPVAFASTSISLTNYLGLSNLRIRFTYNGTAGSNWAMDDIAIPAAYQPVTYTWSPSTYLSATTGQTVTATPTVAGTYTYTVSASSNGCASGSANVTITVNPIPNAVASSSSQTICSGSAITAVSFSGSVSPTTYNWTRNNTINVTGIASSGTGTIGGALINTTSVPQTVTFTITPTANSCTGTSITCTVVVNPIPNVVVVPSTQTICSSSSITTIACSGNVSGTSFNWSRNNTTNVTGIAANGTGNISGSLTNTTSSSQTVIFTITPGANACSGTSTTATVIINPRPKAVISGGNTKCSGQSVTLTITVSGVTGTVSGTLSDGTTFSGTAPTISVNVNPAVTTTYSISSLISTASCGAFPTDLTGSAAVICPSGPAGLWTGSADNDWFNCRNWADGKVPTTSVNVTIDNTASNPCVINVSTSPYASSYGNVATSKNITIDNNSLSFGTVVDNLFAAGSVTIQNNGTVSMTSGGKIELQGDWNDNVNTTGKGFIEKNAAGTIGGSLIFSGSATQKINTMKSEELFYNLQINKTDPADLVGLNSDVTVEHDLTLTQGIFVTGYNLFTWSNTGTLTQPELTYQTNSTNYTRSFIATCDMNGTPINVAGPTSQYQGDAGFRINNVGNTDTYFPVGASFLPSATGEPAAPNRMMINNAGTPQDFTVAINYGDVGYTNSVRVNRIWYVKSDATQANMQLFYTKRDFMGWGSNENEVEAGFDYTQPALIQKDYSGNPGGFVNMSQGTDIIPSLIGHSNNSEVYAQYTIGGSNNLSNGITSFNRFSIVTHSNIVLPVTIINFKAYQQGSGVEIDWSALDERNFDHYEIQRSADASNFTKLADVKAINNGTITYYNQKDLAPVQGNNFYRIKAVDKNGVFMYTSIAKVNICCDKSTVKIYPNPVLNKTFNVQFTNMQKGKYQLLLYNAIGQKVLLKTIDYAGGSATESILLSSTITKGSYFVKVFNESTNVVIPLIIE